MSYSPGRKHDDSTTPLIQLPNDHLMDADIPHLQLGICRPRVLRHTIADRIESEMRGVDSSVLRLTPLKPDVEGMQLALRNLDEKRADNMW